MDTLSKNELFLLAVEMDIPELLNFCKSSKIINEKICKGNEIWYFKLNKEFPEWRKLNIENKTIREIYYLLYILKLGKVKANIEGNIYDLYEKIMKPKPFNDNEIGKGEIIEIIKNLLTLIEHFSHGKNKADYSYLVFSWVAQNLWFLKNHPAFKKIVIKKLEEYRSEPNAKKIIDDFGWLETF